MFRPVISALRSSVANKHLWKASLARQCCQGAFASRLHEPVSLPPPLWSAVDQFILPTSSPSLKQAILDKLPAQPVLAPERRNQSLTLPPSSVVGKMEAGSGLKRLKIYTPPIRKNMLRIRRHKMNKHRLKKFRKKYAALIKKVKTRREVKKEKLFRAELLAQIKEAEQFDAEVHVKKILDTIDKSPKQETLWERRERFDRLRRIHRADVSMLRPKFEDPVN